MMISLPDTDKERLVALVREVSEPEKVYLLGITTMKRRTASLFAPELPGCRYTAHCYLLVLAAGEGQTYQVQELIENHCKAVMPLTAMVIRADEFTGWLQTGHPFACRVVTRAPLLYDGTGVALTAGRLPDEAARAKENRTFFNHELERVEVFMAGADLYRARKEYGMAAFMLHQAAECLLRTALQVMTGYCCHTHNLDKLLRYASLVLWGAPELFERWQPPKEALFKLLQRAYIEARYREGYQVSLAALEGLQAGVMRLREHVREVWMNRLAEEVG